MNDASLIAMDCVAILGIASWFVLIGHNQYGKLSKAWLTERPCIAHTSFLLEWLKEISES